MTEEERIMLTPKMRIEVTTENITKLTVDGIVNAANSALCGGGGVDGAIHRAAGPGLLEECRQLGRCPIGSAVITGAYNLPAQYVIHAVGPVWSGGEKGEAALLESCHLTALQLAKEKGLQTLAFPAISCGAYRFPHLQAARIAVGTISRFLETEALPATILLVCFDPSVKRAYLRALKELGGGPAGRKQ